MKRRLNHKERLWLVLALLIATGCLLLPGMIVNIQADMHQDVVRQASASYYSSKTQTAVRMTLYERMKLISGEWESIWEEADQQKMMNIQEMPQELYPSVSGSQEGALELSGYCYMDYQSVLERVETDLKIFYEAGLYPVNPESTYSNWYRPTVTLYQYSDAVFDSYVCYVWLIELEYYDGSMQHTILMDDTTGMILAAGLGGEDYSLDTKWIQSVNEITTFPESVLDYYRTNQSIWDTVEIADMNVYCPQYDVWNTNYGLTSSQTGTAGGINQKQYLFSASTDISSYAKAVDEVKNTVNNDKFIYSLQWSSQQCWFYLTPFTIRLEQE